jgi:hypothetical protein
MVFIPFVELNFRWPIYLKVHLSAKLFENIEAPKNSALFDALGLPSAAEKIWAAISWKG